MEDTASTPTPPPVHTADRAFSFSLKQMLAKSVAHFEYPWDIVTAAFWSKYHPTNPFVSHVEAYDIISRSVDPATGKLSTVRLVSKRGVIPKWGQFLLSHPQAYIIEFSEVDPASHTMTTVTRNLNHTRIMSVVERQTYRAHPENSAWTQVHTEAKIVSQVGWGLKARVEQFGISRFQTSTEKSRQALRHTLEVLKKLKTTMNAHPAVDPSA